MHVDDQSIEFASLQRRTGALLVDTLGAMILCISSMLCTENTSIKLWLYRDIDIGTRFYWWTYLLICCFFLIEVLSSRSCGKWLLGIRIASRGGIAGIGQRFLRSLLKLLSFHVITILAGVDQPRYHRSIHVPPKLWVVLVCASIVLLLLHSLFIDYTARKLAIHDMLAGTQVIRVRKRVRGFPVLPMGEEHGHRSTAAHATQRAA